MRSVYSYDNYRDFIVDLLKDRGLSQRAFAARYGHLMSRPALAKLLARGRGKTKREASYRVSPERLAQLAKTLRLSDSEAAHLVLLRLENDSEIAPGAFGATYRAILQSLLDMNQRGAAAALSRSEGGSLGQTAESLGVLVDLLPPRARIRVVEEAMTQARIHAARQSNKPGVKSASAVISRALARVEKLIRVGAP